MSETSPVAAGTSPVRRTVHIGRFRFSVPLFLAALIVMLVAAPFVENKAIDAALMTLVLVAGVLAVGRNHRTLLLAIVLVSPAVVARWINRIEYGLMPAEIQDVGALVFIGFVEFQLLHFIFRTRRVNSEVLCAGISGYLLLGVLWMTAYVLVSQLVPNSFSFNVGTPDAGPLQDFDAYYFSFITLSTVGYGDITPISHGARTLAMMEAMTGTLFVAVLISRLVAMYSSENRAGETAGKEAGQPQHFTDQMSINQTKTTC